MQNVVGPTIVAMATKFGLGAEIQSPTGLSSLFTCMALMTGMCTLMTGTCKKFRSSNSQQFWSLGDPA